jgi:hypothetical protein
LSPSVFEVGIFGACHERAPELVVGDQPVRIAAAPRLDLPSAYILVAGRAMPAALLVDLFHRRLQPHLDQSEDPTVADPTGNRLHEFAVRDAVERDANRMPPPTTRFIRTRMRSR